MTGAIKQFSPYTGKEPIIRLFAVMQFAIGALTALGNEMFRFTNKTKGGLILMMVFFYSAYVFGAALWVETGHEIEACATLGSCSYTMMRLTFYDGTGFDYAYALTTHKHNFLFVLVMIYMCVTAFGILNGLVGLFGTAFNRASYMAFEQLDDQDPNTPDNSASSSNSVAGDVDEHGNPVAKSSSADPNDPSGSGIDPSDNDAGASDQDGFADPSNLGFQTVSVNGDVESNTGATDSHSHIAASTVAAHAPKVRVPKNTRNRSLASRQSSDNGSQFDIFNDFPKTRPAPAHHLHPDTSAVMTMMESRFNAMNEQIVRLLHNQSILQQEVERLSVAQGVAPHPMVADRRGQLTPVKPPKKRYFFQKKQQQEQYQELPTTPLSPQTSQSSVAGSVGALVLSAPDDSAPPSPHGKEPQTTTAPHHSDEQREEKVAEVYFSQV